MCLAIPGRVVEISGDEAVLEIAGLTQKANIGLLPDICVGEWCLVHTGFVIQRLSEDEAEETLSLLREYLEAVPEMIGPGAPHAPESVE